MSPFWSNFRFESPWALVLLLLIPLLWWLRRRAIQPSFRLSTTRALQRLAPSWRVRLHQLLNIFPPLILLLLVLALARPQSGSSVSVVDTEGIDIVLSLDVSGSMLAEDFNPNRMEAAKKTAADFISGRPGDRIGLVIFAGESFTQSPLTADHQALLSILQGVGSGQLEDGTAIGMGLGTAVERLRRAPGKSRVIILLTDGVNNAGSIDPETALELAKAYGIRVYTIGIGTNGQAVMPMPTLGGGYVRQMQQVEIDEPLLQKIAAGTGGQYFRATDNAALSRIYAEINRLEKYRAKSRVYTEYTELFAPLALAAFLLLLALATLRLTVLRGLTTAG